MPARFILDIDDEMSKAIDRMIADMELDFPPELAAVATLRDWLIAAGTCQPTSSKTIHLSRGNVANKLADESGLGIAEPLFRVRR